MFPETSTICHKTVNKTEQQAKLFLLRVINERNLSHQQIRTQIDKQLSIVERQLQVQQSEKLVAKQSRLRQLQLALAMLESSTQPSESATGLYQVQEVPLPQKQDWCYVYDTNENEHPLLRKGRMAISVAYIDATTGGYRLPRDHQSDLVVTVGVFPTGQAELRTSGVFFVPLRISEIDQRNFRTGDPSGRLYTPIAVDSVPPDHPERTELMRETANLRTIDVVRSMCDSVPDVSSHRIQIDEAIIRESLHLLAKDTEFGGVISELIHRDEVCQILNATPLKFIDAILANVSFPYEERDKVIFEVAKELCSKLKRIDLPSIGFQDLLYQVRLSLYVGGIVDGNKYIPKNMRATDLIRLFNDYLEQKKSETSMPLEQAAPSDVEGGNGCLKKVFLACIILTLTQLCLNPQARQMAVTLYEMIRGSDIRDDFSWVEEKIRALMSEESMTDTLCSDVYGFGLNPDQGEVQRILAENIESIADSEGASFVPGVSNVNGSPMLPIHLSDRVVFAEQPVYLPPSASYETRTNDGTTYHLIESNVDSDNAGSVSSNASSTELVPMVSFGAPFDLSVLEHRFDQQGYYIIRAAYAPEKKILEYSNGIPRLTVEFILSTQPDVLPEKGTHISSGLPLSTGMDPVRGIELLETRYYDHNGNPVNPDTTMHELRSRDIFQIPSRLKATMEATIDNKMNDQVIQDIVARLPTITMSSVERNITPPFAVVYLLDQAGYQVDTATFLSQYTGGKISPEEYTQLLQDADTIRGLAHYSLHPDAVELHQESVDEVLRGIPELANLFPDRVDVDGSSNVVEDNQYVSDVMTIFEAEQLRANTERMQGVELGNRQQRLIELASQLGIIAERNRSKQPILAAYADLLVDSLGEQAAKQHTSG